MKKILSKKGEEGQAVIILAAMMFVIIALLILSAVGGINRIRDKANLIDAAIAAATNGVSRGTETANRNFDEDAAILSACQTMDDYLPIKLLSVGFGRSSMRVTVAKVNSSGRRDRATFTTFYSIGDEAEISGSSNYQFGSTINSTEIATRVDGCQGRVLT